MIGANSCQCILILANTCLLLVPISVSIFFVVSNVIRAPNDGYGILPASGQLQAVVFKGFLVLEVLEVLLFRRIVHLMEIIWEILSSKTCLLAILMIEARPRR